MEHTFIIKLLLWAYAQIGTVELQLIFTTDAERWQIGVCLIKCTKTKMKCQIKLP